MKKCLVVVLVLFSACTQKEDKTKISQYFDLEGLVVQQTELLSVKGVNLEKTVNLNGQTESTLLIGTKENLEKEWQFFKESDINKSTFLDAYSILKDDSLEFQRVIYRAKNLQKQEVKEINLRYNQSKLERIQIHYKRQNYVFFSERKLQLGLDSSQVISNYSVSGNQKMILKKPSYYFVSGIIKNQ